MDLGLSKDNLFLEDLSAKKINIQYRSDDPILEIYSSQFSLRGKNNTKMDKFLDKNRSPGENLQELLSR